MSDGGIRAAGGPFLAEAERQALGALALAILRGAPGPDPSLPPIAERVDARLHTLPADKRRQVGQAIRLLASPLGGLLVGSTPRTFASLTPEAQAARLNRWMLSPLGLVRSAAQTVRRLVMAVHYADPTASGAIGYSAPAPGSAQSLEVGTPREGERGAWSPMPSSTAVDPLVPTGRLSADVVVIGTGAGGSVAAARLAEAGYRVVMLESGHWHRAEDFDNNEARQIERLCADGGLRTTDDAAIALVQGEAVGGSTLVNWMIMLRTPDFVLAGWAAHHGISGMGPSDMAPVFDRIEREVHASAVPDVAHSANNAKLLAGARALGWRAHAGQLNVVGCRRCGCCGIGCRYGAKQSADVTYVPRALAAGATLFTGTRATRIEVLERDVGPLRQGTPPLKRLVATRRHANGQVTTLHVEAPLVLCAAGAIETPVLLQQSGMGGDAVGQWLRLHPTTAVYAQYDEEILASSGIPLSTVCDEFLQWQQSDYGFWIETPPMLPSFTAAALPGFGESHARCMAQYRHLGVTIGLTRDGAMRTQSSGRVSVNRRGQRSIHYRLSTEDAARVSASIQAMARLHLAAGAREVGTMHTVPRVVRHERDIASLAGGIFPNGLALFSAHVNGTCRMGTLRHTSATSPDGERHGVRGVYITDGSVLPTALGVNPQQTIMAVASVLAERMAERHAGLLRT
jgi:choline dehydrogenase-like flavoprotein